MKKALTAVAAGLMLFATQASADNQDSFTSGRSVFRANGSFYNYCQGLARQAAALSASQWSLREVPAPGSLGLLAVGIVGAACGRRRASNGLNLFTLNTRALPACPVCNHGGQDYRSVKDRFGLHTA